MRHLGFLWLMPLVVLCGCGPDAPAPATSSSSATGQDPTSTTETEDAYPQGEPSLARNFYFVFDDSGSMDKKVGGAESRIAIARRATIQFLKQVPADVRMGLYALNRGELVPLGSDNRDRFIEVVQQLDAAGGTPLNAAITKGVNVLVEQRKRQLGYGDFRVIVVTDGESGDGDVAKKAGPQAAKAKIPLYTIGFCVDGDHALRRFSVSYRAADSEQDLQRGLEEVAGESEAFDAATFRK